MTAISTKRNLSMEICKMFAAFAVVGLHVEFPGESNRFFSCLFQFANPTFFAITGYFNYQATGPQLRRRLKHILDLYITAWLFHLLYGCVITELDGGSTIACLRAAVPDLDEIFRWIAFQQDSFLAQLWFLASTGVCYLLLWGYTRLFEGRPVRYLPLYLVGCSLFSVYFLLNVILPVTGQSVDFYLFRNAWFFAIPFFLFGMFLRQYREKIARCFPTAAVTQWLMILGGSALCVIQLYSGAPFGFPFGTFLVVLGLLLFCSDHPSIPWLPQWCQRLAAKFGVYSSGIYLFHITVKLAYERFLLSTVESVLKTREPWFRTLLVWLISLLVAILWDWVITLARRCLKKR